MAKVITSRSPLGLRGLKLTPPEQTLDELKSQPSWAAWIEICARGWRCGGDRVAALLGCVD